MTDIKDNNADHITTTVIEEVREVQPGLITRLFEKFQENPIKTSVALSAGLGAAAVGTYNYRTTGAILGNSGRQTSRAIGEGARLVASFITR